MAYAERSPAGPGPKNSSFRFRRLRIVLTLSRGTFASGQNALVIDNLAMKARIQKVPFPDSGKASIEIVGMKQSDMEALTTLAMLNNKINVTCYKIRRALSDGASRW